ncbi:MAG: nitroreductase [Alphaproteobacteria bacterium]
MKVSEALDTRLTCRAFTDQPVPQEMIKEIIEKSARAPSGGNLQPWHVHAIAGDVKDELIKRVREQMPEKPMGEGAEYDIYPKELKNPYEARRRDIGERMYGTLEIPKEDRGKRIAWFMKNFEFFNAPVALVFSIDKQMGEGQWSDLGMYIQSLMLLAREYGLHTCPQEAWAMWQGTIRDLLDIPEERMVFCAVGIGYMDEDHVVNTLRSPRAPLEEYCQFSGF